MVDIPYVSVAGLRIPAPLVPRIIAAFRAIYPTVTADLDDDAAVRATLLHLVSVIVTTHETQAVMGPLKANADQLIAQAEERGNRARMAALAAVGTILSASPTEINADLELSDFSGASAALARQKV